MGMWNQRRKRTPLKGRSIPCAARSLRLHVTRERVEVMRVKLAPRLFKLLRTFMVTVLLFAVSNFPLLGQAGIAYAAIGTIEITGVTGSEYQITAIGTWDPQGAQCNSAEGKEKYWIVVNWGDGNFGPAIDPAPCTSAKEGADWTSQQAYSVPGAYQVCATLYHASPKGQDIAQTTSCWPANVQIPFVPHTLTVTLAGTGNGTVTSSPTGIACGSDCTETYLSGTPVVLMATSTIGSTFAGWSGAADCSDGWV